MPSPRQRFSPVMSDVGDRALSPTLSTSSRTTTSVPTDMSDVSSIDGEDFEVIEAPHSDHEPSSPQQTPLMESFDDLGEAQWSQSSLVSLGGGESAESDNALSASAQPMTASDVLMSRTSWANIAQHDHVSDSVSSSLLRFPDPLDSSFQFSDHDVGGSEAGSTNVRDAGKQPQTAPRMRERSTSTSTLNARAANDGNANPESSEKHQTSFALPPIQQNLIIHFLKSLSKETVMTMVCLALMGIPTVFNWLYSAHTTVGPAIMKPRETVVLSGHAAPIVSSMPLNTHVGKALLMLSPKRNNALMVLSSSKPLPEARTRSSSYRQKYKVYSAPTAVVSEVVGLKDQKERRLSLYDSDPLSMRFQRSSRNAKRLIKRLQKDWNEWMRAAHNFVQPIRIAIVREMLLMEQHARQTWEEYGVSSHRDWNDFNDRFRSFYEYSKSYAGRTSTFVKSKWSYVYRYARYFTEQVNRLRDEELLNVRQAFDDAFSPVKAAANAILAHVQLDWQAWMRAATQLWQQFVTQFQKDVYRGRAQAAKAQRQAHKLWKTVYGKAAHMTHDAYAAASCRLTPIERDAANAYRQATLRRRERKAKARQQGAEQGMPFDKKQLLKSAEDEYEKLLLHAGRLRVRMGEAWSGFACDKGKSDSDDQLSAMDQVHRLYELGSLSTRRSVRRTMRRGRKLRRRLSKVASKKSQLVWTM